MTDPWNKFSQSIPELLEENGINEVLAALAEHFDNEAMKQNVCETSQKYKDLMLASDILNAAAAGTSLNFGWKVPLEKSEDVREVAKKNFLAQAKTIKKYDYS